MAIDHPRALPSRPAAAAASSDRITVRRDAAVEQWTTDQAARALEIVSVATPLTLRRGTSVSLAIPLDEQAQSSHDAPGGGLPPLAGRPRREPLRRDSLKRREALLKGKEGSRRRQRWENDRLLSNPYAQPPLPSDWEVQPTYPRLPTVPYYLAPLWDGELGRRAVAKKEEETEKRKSRRNNGSGTGTKSTPGVAGLGEVPDRVARELRETLRKKKAAKSLLKDLEEEIRKWVEGRVSATAAGGRSNTHQGDEYADDGDGDGVRSVSSEEDEEIVFVGRNGSMRDARRGPRSGSSQQAAGERTAAPSQAENNSELSEKDKLIFDSPADDRRASFGRWLVHNIATYYGLRAWSITVGDPARREAYVSLRDDVEDGSRPASATSGTETDTMGSMVLLSKGPTGLERGGMGMGTALPRPLWGLV